MNAETRDDGFDPVMLAEIAAMTDPPMTKQHALWLMAQPGAPAYKSLARGKVWRKSEAEAFVRAHAARVAAGRPAGEPGPEELELREWIASGRARDVRRGAGLTFEAMAAGLGVAWQTLRRWEIGEHVPGADHAAAYHALLTRLAAGQDGASDG